MVSASKGCTSVLWVQNEADMSQARRDEFPVLTESEADMNQARGEKLPVMTESVPVTVRHG